MVGMADGYAQASRQADARQPAHRARASATRWARSSTPRPTTRRCVITAGQQVARADDAAGQPHQPRRDPDAAPARQVELRAAARRGRAAGARPRRPPRRAAAAGARSSSRSRWTTGTPRSTTADAAHAIARTVSGRAVADPEAGRASLAERLDAAANPVLVAGPDIDASGGWDAAVALAERQRLPVWATPATGGGRIGFPEGHPQLPRHRCRRRSARSARRSRATTWCSSSAPRSSPTTRTSPGRCCRRARSWSRSPATPTRRRGRRWATRSSPTSSSPSRRCSRRSPSRTARRRSRPAARRIPPSRPAQPLDGAHALARGPPRGRRSSCSSRPRAPWRCATSCGSRARAATTSAPAAASASASRPRSASSSPSPTARSSA